MVSENDAKNLNTFSRYFYAKKFHVNVETIS